MTMMMMMVMMMTIIIIIIMIIIIIVIIIIIIIITTMCVMTGQLGGGDFHVYGQSACQTEHLPGTQRYGIFLLKLLLF